MHEFGRTMEGYDVWRSVRLDSRQLLRVHYALCQQAEQDYWDQSSKTHVALGTKAGKDVLDFRLRADPHHMPGGWQLPRASSRMDSGQIYLHGR